MAASRICEYRRIASGSRTCWCTTAPTRASTAPTRPTWWCGTTARACTCRRASSSRHAKSTSRGSRSTINAARWSSAAGPMMDFRFDSVARQPGSTPQLVVLMLELNEINYIFFVVFYELSLVWFIAKILLNATMKNMTMMEVEIYIFILFYPLLIVTKAGFAITRWNWRWYQQLRAQRRVGTTGWVSQCQNQNQKQENSQQKDRQNRIKNNTKSQ